MPNKVDSAKYCFWVILNVTLVTVAALAIVSTLAVKRYSRSISADQTITVSADGKVTVVPDLATLHFSLLAEGADPVKLQNDNNAKMEGVIAYVKSQGVEPKDIKTTGYNLGPKYTYNPKTGRSSIDGYILNQSAEIKIRDFTKISPILAALPSKGINDISGPNFSVDDPDTFLNQAREEAFTKAKEKAKAMAGFAGSRLGRVVTFSDSSGYPPIFYYARDAKEGGLGGGPVPAPAIEPGSQEVSVQISVTYEIW